ncbi:hypothetical protein GALL_509670 [mine drainage metagenome]|uniref:LTXXQ motif family protein n=1 Tax=mine drainage metagenome TaxID=410659 RepID=A0A1J5P880_9ZZZZ
MKLKSAILIGAVLAAPALPVMAATQPPPVVSGASAPTIRGRVEQRLARLHTEFGITPDQEKLWGQFADVVRSNARTMGGLFSQRRAALPTMTAADNMHSLTEIAAQHARAMQWMDAAFMALYTSMPPAQQKATDAAMRAEGMKARP